MPRIAVGETRELADNLMNPFAKESAEETTRLLTRRITAGKLELPLFFYVDRIHSQWGVLLIFTRVIILVHC